LKYSAKPPFGAAWRIEDNVEQALFHQVGLTESEADYRRNAKESALC
jgi:hypothetical protein